MSEETPAAEAPNRATAPNQSTPDDADDLPLPPATALLRKGDDRYAERILRGPLAEGTEGALALYTYETERTDSKGNRQTNYYHYTVGISELPDSVRWVPELYCRRKFGFRALERLEAAFRSTQRVELESEALDQRYEIFAAPEQDANWLRQLFSPTFMVWLSETAPEKFAHALLPRERAPQERRRAGHDASGDGCGREPVARRGTRVAPMALSSRIARISRHI